MLALLASDGDEGQVPDPFMRLLGSVELSDKIIELSEFLRPYFRMYVRMTVSAVTSWFSNSFVKSCTSSTARTRELGDELLYVFVSLA